jgi:hypothetical protein
VAKILMERRHRERLELGLNRESDRLSRLAPPLVSANRHARKIDHGDIHVGCGRPSGNDIVCLVGFAAAASSSVDLVGGADGAQQG